MVRGRSDQRGLKFRNTSRSTSRFKRKCFVCNSEKHLKRDCPEWKKKKGEQSSHKNFNSHNTQEDSSDGYESSDVLMVSNSADKEK